MTDIQAKRIAVLTAAAKAKSQAKIRAAEQGIRALVKRGEPVTFQAVQREAGVSHAFLYNHPDLRARIEHLRGRTPPNPGTSVTPDSENTLVLALTAQISELQKRYRQDIQALRDALEQAHGENLDLRRQLSRQGPGPGTAHPTAHVESIATTT